MVYLGSSEAHSSDMRPRKSVITRPDSGGADLTKLKSASSLAAGSNIPSNEGGYHGHSLSGDPFQDVKTHQGSSVRGIVSKVVTFVMTRLVNLVRKGRKHVSSLLVSSAVAPGIQTRPPKNFSRAQTLPSFAWNIVPSC